MIETPKCVRRKKGKAEKKRFDQFIVARQIRPQAFTAFRRRIASDDSDLARVGEEILAWWRYWVLRNPALLESALVSSPPGTIKGKTMTNPLESIWGTIISGLILTAILYWAALALLH